MNIKLKYPQQFKKQHKKRINMAAFKPGAGLCPVTPKHVNLHQIICTQRTRIPNKFVTYIRKLLRKFCKKRKIQCWFPVTPNYMVSSKAKNSRMGKGTGTINRVAYLMPEKAPILILGNITYKRAQLLLCLLQARLPVKLQLT